jgi:hypothetical protein
MIECLRVEVDPPHNLQAWYGSAMVTFSIFIGDGHPQHVGNPQKLTIFFVAYWWWPDHPPIWVDFWPWLWRLGGTSFRFMSWVMSALEPLTIRFRAGKIHIYIKSLECHSMTRDLMSLNVIFWSYKCHKIHMDQIPWNAIVFSNSVDPWLPRWTCLRHCDDGFEKASKRLCSSWHLEGLNFSASPAWEKTVNGSSEAFGIIVPNWIADNRIHQTPADIYMYLCTV